MFKLISWRQALLLLLEMVVVQSLPIIRPELSPEEHCCPLAHSRLWIKTVYGLDLSASDLVTPLLSYRFLLPELQLRDGLGHIGSAVRLRNVVSNLTKAPRTLKVGVVGGSVSWGEGATERGSTDWFSVFIDWLTSVSGAKVSARNGCVPATTATYTMLCLEHSVDPDVDLVFVECGMKDGFMDKVILNGVVMGLEKLLRRLLGLPGRPAVVLVQVPYLRATSFSPFPITSEDVEGALAAYYDLPTVSLRNALYPLNVNEPTDGFFLNQTFSNMHPGDAGHKALADLVVHLVQEIALGLVRYPITRSEMRQRDNEPLPPPMYEGNLPPASPSCVVGHDLRGVVKSAKGWSWVKEGSTAKPKWGLVASTPGSALLLRLNTRDPHAAGGAVKPVPTVPVLLHYQKSNQTVMGTVQVCCKGGCECQTQVLNGWHEERVPQTSMAYIKTFRVGDEATTCDLTLTVMADTSTAGHKFKISGVVIGVGHDLTGTYDHKYWRIPEDV